MKERKGFVSNSSSSSFIVSGLEDHVEHMEQLEEESFTLEELIMNNSSVNGDVTYFVYVTNFENKVEIISDEKYCTLFANEPESLLLVPKGAEAEYIEVRDHALKSGKSLWDWNEPDHRRNNDKLHKLLDKYCRKLIEILTPMYGEMIFHEYTGSRNEFIRGSEEVLLEEIVGNFKDCRASFKRDLGE